MNGNIFLSKKTLWNESKKHMQDGTGQTITAENRQRAVVFGWRESVQKHNRKFQIDPDRGCPGLRGEDPEGDAADDMTSLKAESPEIDRDPAESEPWVAGRRPLNGGRGGPRGPEALLAARSAAGPAVRTTQEGSVGEEPADWGAAAGASAEWICRARGRRGRRDADAAAGGRGARDRGAPRVRGRRGARRAGPAWLCTPHPAAEAEWKRDHGRMSRTPLGSQPFQF